MNKLSSCDVYMHNDFCHLTELAQSFSLNMQCFILVITLAAGSKVVL